MGLMRPTSGVVRVLGDEIQPGSKAIRRRIGYVPDGDAFFPELNGIEAVAYAGRLVGMRGADALQRAHQVLDYVELGEARYRMVEKYSTGMRQRLKLAQALVHDPDLLILDEPTEGVDPEARVHILNLIQEVSKEHGLQMILSTHLLNDVERLASHALVLNQGRAVASGSIAELKAAPTKSYIVRVNGSADPLTQLLTEQGVKWEPMQPSVRIFLDDPKEVLQAVKQAGLVVRHLAPTELSLGEAFEQAVQGGQTNA
jgi:ABC-2 type transport system ATP-binding protein